MLAGPGRRGPGRQPLTGPPRAWPAAAGRACGRPDHPGPAASCGRRMRRGLRSQPRRVLTGTPSARQACLPGEEGGWGHSHRNSIADISRHSRATGRAPEQHCGSGARVAERFTRSGARCAWSDTRCTSDGHVQRARFSRSSCSK